MADDVKTVVTKREGVESTVTTDDVNTVQTIAMPWWQIVLVRTARVYVQSLLGVIMAGATGFAGALGIQMPAGDLAHLLLTAAGLALAPAVFTLLQNIVELLTKLDATRPTFRA